MSVLSLLPYNSIKGVIFIHISLWQSTGFTELLASTTLLPTGKLIQKWQRKIFFMNFQLFSSEWILFCWFCWWFGIASCFWMYKVECWCCFEFDYFDNLMKSCHNSIQWTLIRITNFIYFFPFVNPLISPQYDYKRIKCDEVISNQLYFHAWNEKR